MVKDDELSMLIKQLEEKCSMYDKFIQNNQYVIAFLDGLVDDARKQMFKIQDESTGIVFQWLLEERRALQDSVGNNKLDIIRERIFLNVLKEYRDANNKKYTDHKRMPTRYEAEQYK